MQYHGVLLAVVFFDWPHVDYLFGCRFPRRLKCNGFNKSFLNVNFLIFLKVEDTILELILEPKNGLATTNFGF